MGGDSSLRDCTRQLQLDHDIWCYIFEKLDSSIDGNSFALTCVAFRDMRNSSRKCLKIRCSTTTTITDDSIASTIIIDPSIIDKLVSRHTKLETLTLGCLSNCRHITYSCLTSLLNYGSTLHSLDLNDCLRITDTGLSLVASACPLLSVISLNLTSVSDHGLEILSKSCEFLKEVNLEDCMCITDDGICFLNQNCRQLRVLRISGCRKIRGAGFQECSPTLAHLEACHCYFGSVGVSQIVSGGGLEYLNLGRRFPGSGRLSIANDDVIAKISRGCPLLQEWNLTGCNRIGISGWESIGLFCQNLETLHVAGCKNLCDERGLVSIGAGCKRMSVLIVDQTQYRSDKVHHFRLQRRDVEIKRKGFLNPFGSWGIQSS
ncbi:F-box/LRR-repeat protein 12-like [Rutidosis leptorrhynchoides]|uniref:F-box/LRR-repeat protein 12-like n=1 Tax=Rutidosis leptorrhynchoides TaxID=125765 RepID=UPI003A9A4472